MTKFDGMDSGKTYTFLSTELEMDRCGFLVSWSAKDVGFGTASFQWVDGKLVVDLEAMCDRFVEELLIEIAPKLAKAFGEAYDNR